MRRSYLVLGAVVLSIAVIWVWMSRPSHKPVAENLHSDVGIASESKTKSEGMESGAVTGSTAPSSVAPSGAKHEDTLAPAVPAGATTTSAATANDPQNETSANPQDPAAVDASNAEEINSTKKQLQGLRIHDLPAVVGRSKAIDTLKTPEAKGVQGSFAGQLEPSAYNKEAWQIETNIQITEQDSGKFTSDYTISIQSASKGRFSNSSGQGILESVRRSDKLNGLLLQLSPTMYIHALYAPAADALVGNFYSIDDQGKTLFHGPLVLNRQ